MKYTFRQNICVYIYYICLGIEHLSSRIISLSSNTTQEITIYDNNDNKLPEWVRFITVAVHSQQFNITLIQLNNNQTISSINSTITGRNIGLVLIADEDSGLLFINNNNSVDINVLIVANAHKVNGINCL